MFKKKLLFLQVSEKPDQFYFEMLNHVPTLSTCQIFSMCPLYDNLGPSINSIQFLGSFLIPYYPICNFFHLNNYFDFHVCLSVRPSVRPCVSENQLHFLQSYDKMSLIKVAWCVFRVKNMHPGSTSHPSWTAPAEVRILDFQTTLSEFQAQSQTAAARGEAKLRIYNLKKTSPTQSWSQAVVCVSTPRIYPCSRYFLVHSKNNLFQKLKSSWLLKYYQRLLTVPASHVQYASMYRCRFRPELLSRRHKHAKKLFGALLYCQSATNTMFSF